MSETVDGTPTPESETPAVEATPAIDLDQRVKVGGEEMSLSQIAQLRQSAQELSEENEALHEFRASTFRLMNPGTENEVRKSDLKNILEDAGYSDEQIQHYSSIYDQGGQQAQAQSAAAPQAQAAPMQDDQAREQNQRLEQQLSQMRARMLNENLDKAISSAVSSSENGKVLNEWMKSNHAEDSLATANSSLEKRVRDKALENLRIRRNQAGTFDEAWVTDEVAKAANDVAKDMLTVIGDTSKIGRVPETAGQTENLYRQKPVELPEVGNKNFGEIEGQLRDWTSDQILRSLADTGGDSKL